MMLKINIYKKSLLYREIFTTIVNFLFNKIYKIYTSCKLIVNVYLRIDPGFESFLLYKYSRAVKTRFF